MIGDLCNIYGQTRQSFAIEIIRMDRVVGAIANIGSIARRHCTLISQLFRFLEPGAAFSIWNAIGARCSWSCSVVQSLRRMIERRKYSRTDEWFLFAFFYFPLPVEKSQQPVYHRGEKFVCRKTRFTRIRAALFDRAIFDLQ